MHNNNGQKHCWKKFDGLTCHPYTKILEAWPSVSPLTVQCWDFLCQQSKVREKKHPSGK